MATACCFCTNASRISDLVRASIQIASLLSSVYLDCCRDGQQMRIVRCWHPLHNCGGLASSRNTAFLCIKVAINMVVSLLARGEGGDVTGYRSQDGAGVQGAC